MSPRLFPERIDKCPLNPDCTAKRLYRDVETGDVLRLDTHVAEFRPHVCRTFTYRKPTIVYLGEWRNTRTNRTRHLGPSRSQETVLLPPLDENYAQRGGEESWKLVNLYASELTWKRVEGAMPRSRKRSISGPLRKK